MDGGERCVLLYSPPSTDQILRFHLDGTRKAAMAAAQGQGEDALRKIMESVTREKLIASALDLVVDCRGYECLQPDSSGDVEVGGEKYSWKQLGQDIQDWKTHLEVSAGHHLLLLANHVFGAVINSPSAARFLPKDKKDELVDAAEKSEKDQADLKKN